MSDAAREMENSHRPNSQRRLQTGGRTGASSRRRSSITLESLSAAIGRPRSRSQDDSFGTSSFNSSMNQNSILSSSLSSSGYGSFGSSRMLLLADVFSEALEISRAIDDYLYDDSSTFGKPPTVPEGRLKRRSTK